MKNLPPFGHRYAAGGRGCPPLRTGTNRLSRRGGCPHPPERYHNAAAFRREQAPDLRNIRNNSECRGRSPIARRWEMTGKRRFSSAQKKKQRVLPLRTLKTELPPPEVIQDLRTVCHEALLSPPTEELPHSGPLSIRGPKERRK